MTVARRRDARRSRAEGFALVEALASLVVASLIALMIVQGIQTGGRVWERIDVTENRGEALDGAQSVLRDRLEQTFPATRYDQAPPYVEFAGSERQMTFLTSPPYWQRPAPLWRYTLTLDRQNRLVLDGLSDVASASDQPSTQVLLTRVKGLDLAYFGAAAPDGQRRWRGAWRDESTLPEVVRIRVRLAPGDHRQWPDLIVRPRATIDSQCILSTLTHRCKGRL